MKQLKLKYVVLKQTQIIYKLVYKHKKKIFKMSKEIKNPKTKKI